MESAGELLTDEEEYIPDTTSQRVIESICEMKFSRMKEEQRPNRHVNVPFLMSVMIKLIGKTILNVDFLNKYDVFLSGLMNRIEEPDFLVIPTVL